MDIFNLQIEQLVEVQPGRYLSSKTANAFKCLRESAYKAGFDIQVASAFRDVERQQFIWNAKASGARPILDERGQVLMPSSLTNEEKVFAILRWSALPGASRHHWGTDLDVFDAAAINNDYELQLIPEEYSPSGVFATFNDWLTKHLDAFGFYRPYAQDCGGIAPEPWHISFYEEARNMEAQLTLEALASFITSQNIMLKQDVLANLDEIYHRFILLR